MLTTAAELQPIAPSLTGDHDHQSKGFPLQQNCVWRRRKGKLRIDPKK